MLNLQVGDEAVLRGLRHIRTRPGVQGHAIYGPYERLEPGRYGVEFTIRRDEDADAADIACALVDVVADEGRRTIASDLVFASQLCAGSAPVRLDFAIDTPLVLEYRVHVSGAVRLLIEDLPRVRARSDDGSSSRCAGRHGDTLRTLYDRGALEQRDGRLVATLGGITFAADRYDDVNFVDELFFKSAYNFRSEQPSCVIDVGMNVGLASLLFARQDSVREVHAFEPFTETYERGMNNLALNPALAAKISPHNFGLSDKDEEAVFRVLDTGGDSGAQSTRDVDGGVPVRLRLHDAAATLGPIIASARARNLQVIAKIDCEGSEFAVFRSLAGAGLFGDLALIMVEWHTMFEGRTQEELIEPLLSAGFTVIDLSPPTGNGFFYAAKTERRPGASSDVSN